MMMEVLNHLLLGLESALTLTNLGYCFLGVLIGTFVGVLPGLGPVATLALLLPITYALDPTSAIIMLAGIYYGVDSQIAEKALTYLDDFQKDCLNRFEKAFKLQR